MPVKVDKDYACDLATGELTQAQVLINRAPQTDLSADARAYYECAAYLYKNGLYGMIHAEQPRH